MRAVYLLLLLLVLPASGCVNNVAAAPTPKTPTFPVEEQKLVAGSDVELTIIRPNDNAKISYRGTITSVDAQMVAFNKPTKRVEVTQTASIPLVGNVLKSTAVGSEKAPGAVQVKRSEITNIREFSPPPTTAGEAELKQPNSL